MQVAIGTCLCLLARSVRSAKECVTCIKRVLKTTWRFKNNVSWLRVGLDVHIQW